MTYLTSEMGATSYFDGYTASVAVSVAAASHWYKAGGTTGSTYTNDFTQSNGVFTYTGQETKLFHIYLSVSVSFSANNTTLIFAIIKNGTTICSCSKNRIKLVNSTDTNSLSVATLLTLSQNDTVTAIFSSDNTGTATIQFISMMIAET